VVEPRDAFPGKHAVEHDLATAARQPAAHLDRALLAGAVELPQVDQDAGRIAHQHARVLLELARMLRYATRGPVVGCSDNRRTGVSELAMHQLARLRPAVKDEHVGDLRVLVGQAVDHPDVDLDIGKSGMESRQRRQQDVQGKLRMGSDHQRAGRSLPERRSVSSKAPSSASIGRHASR
jgi:hypothetical protein